MNVWLARRSVLKSFVAWDHADREQTETHSCSISAVRTIACSFFSRENSGPLLRWNVVHVSVAMSLRLFRSFCSSSEGTCTFYQSRSLIFAGSKRSLCRGICYHMWCGVWGPTECCIQAEHVFPDRQASSHGAESFLDQDLDQGWILNLAAYGAVFFLEPRNAAGRVASLDIRSSEPKVYICKW